MPVTHGVAGSSPVRTANNIFNEDSGCSAVRLAHLLWEQGVPGSNPGTRQIKIKELQYKVAPFFVARMGRLNWQLTWIMSTKMSTIKTMNAIKTLANGEHPLMLRICKDGKRKYQRNIDQSEILGF